MGDRDSYRQACLTVGHAVIADAIGERQLALPAHHLDLQVTWDHVYRRMLVHLSAMFAAGDRVESHEVEVKYLADWRQAFKARWFDYRPLRWLLRRYPPQYTTRKVRTVSVTRVCPHLPLDKEAMRRGHYEFLLAPAGDFPPPRQSL